MNLNPIHDKLEQLLFDFEQRWIEDNSVRIEDFLPAPSLPNYLEILTELVRSEMEFRSEKGLEFGAAYYFRRFPVLAKNSVANKAVVFEENRLRNSSGSNMAPLDLGTQKDIDANTWPQVPVCSSEVRGCGESTSDSRSARKSKVVFPNVGERFLNFELVGQLGDGAFGRVFLGQQGDLEGRLVVLKFTSAATDEHRLLARLQHTNIVPIHSVHRFENLQAICMPLLGVATLEDILRQCGKKTDPSRVSIHSNALVRTVNQQRESTVVATICDEANVQAFRSRQRLNEGPNTPHDRGSLQNFAATFIQQTAEGLGYAHQHGIIHGDLKPANVLVDDDGNAIILDFHLSNLKNEDIGQHVGGTVAYMAPEHLRSLHAGICVPEPTTDVYSTGTMLYEILTGKLPYQAEMKDSFTIDEFATAKDAPFVISKKERAVIGEDLSAIIQICLDPNPAKRFQNGNELALELDRHLNFEPLKIASRGSFRNRVQKWSKRNPRLSSASTILPICSLVLVAATVAFLTVNSKLNKFYATAESNRHIELVQTVLPTYATNALLDISYFQAAINKSNEIAQENLWESRDDLEHAKFFKRLEQQDATAELESAAQLHFWIAEACQQFAKSREATKYLELALNHNQSAVSFWPTDRTKQSLIKQRRIILDTLGQQDEALGIERSPTELDNRLDEILSAYLERRDSLEAEKRLTRLAEARPDDFLVWMMLGNICAERKEFEKATAYYTHCRSLDSNSSLPVMCRGIANMEQGKYDAALEDFKLADQLSPDDVNISLNYALALIKKRDYENAKSKLDDAIELGAQQTRVWYLRSGVRQRLGDESGSQEDLEIFLEKQPLDETSCITRGNQKIKDSPHDAIRDFEAALKFDPRSLVAHNNLANVYSEVLGETEKAIEHMNKMIDINSEDPFSLAARGVLLARIGQRDRAIRDAESALRLDSTANTRYRVAGIFAQTSKIEPADAERAISLFAKAAYRDPGMVLTLLKDDPDIAPIKGNVTFTTILDAIQELRQALKEDPSEN